MGLIIVFFFYLLPNAEYLLLGNTAMHIVYLDIRNKKMVLYCCFVSSILVSFTTYQRAMYLIYSLFLFSTYFYFKCIKTWYPYIRLF